jgi:diacylglycerol kinase
MLRNQSLKDAFINAYNGLRYVFKTQRNAKIHLLITIVVLLFGFFFRIASIQWVAILLVIGLVWAAECMNTAIEKLTDLASPDFHILAKIAKDCAAAAVLMASITAFVVGLVIFIPRFLVVLHSF